MRSHICHKYCPSSPREDNIPQVHVRINRKNSLLKLLETKTLPQVQGLLIKILLLFHGDSSCVTDERMPYPRAEDSSSQN